jgi:hypothetical protein
VSMTVFCYGHFCFQKLKSLFVLWINGDFYRTAVS